GGAFARRALAADEPGGLRLADALAERRARGPEILDACRWSLERLVGAAERAGMRLSLQLGVTPWQAPSPREASDLHETFGPALGIVWDPARLSILAALDLAIADDRLKTLAASALVVLDNDAVGLVPGYLPGLGERDARFATFSPPDAALRIITGGADATAGEVAAALA
ncbi:MAG TPA: hypothetical protein VFG23_05050, partial [Polyangia bacterium]|nr:hypothetical protein [Polyangia bacterium]